MSNNNPSGDISNEKINAMLKMASGKLGMSPDQLKGVLSDKKATDELLNKLGGKSKFKSALESPEALEKMLNDNPKAKKMMSDLMGDKKFE